MKRVLSVFAVAGIIGLTSWNMTASATEQFESVEENVTVVSFDFEENFEPVDVYTLKGAQCFSYADGSRYEYDFRTDEKLYCLQKTTNGFYCVVTQDGDVCYVLQDAVSATSDEMKDASLIEVKPYEMNCETILFVFSSFDTDLEQIVITDITTGKQIVLKGMACIDYQNPAFLTTYSQKVSVTKSYLDGTVIDQTFSLREGNRMVGIFDDGSKDESWIEIDGEYIFE